MVKMVNPLAPKLHGTLDVHINENLRQYPLGSIRKIGVEPVTHDPVYVTEYWMKGLKRHSFLEDEILIFRGLSANCLPTDRFWLLERS
jgi:hypothetical protein